MAQTTTKKKRRKKRRRRRTGNTGVLLAALVLAVILLTLLFRWAYRWGQSAAPEDEETAVTETLPSSPLSSQGFGWSEGFKTYEDEQRVAKVGIDVSSHQGEIDWQAVRQSGVEFAVIRAGFRGYGDGSTRQDECFSYNIESARENGLEVGIYFFSQALNEEEARAEAHEVLSMLEGYEIQLPIYYDWEPITEDEARTDTISASELTACAKAFCQVIEAAGYRAGIYFNLNIAVDYYHILELGDYAFWLAEYQETPSFPFAFSMWQYTSQGTVAGVDTNVDLDLYFIEK